MKVYRAKDTPKKIAAAYVRAAASVELANLTLTAGSG